MNRVVRFQHHENLSWPPNRQMVERIPPGLKKKLARANEMDIELYEKAKALSRDYFKKNTGYYQIEYLKRDRCNFSLPSMFRPKTFRNVPGSLPIQFFHFLFDIAELQRRMGADSASLLDQCADEREIVALKDLFGRDRVFAHPVSSGFVNEFDDPSHDVSRGAEIEKVDRLPRLEPGARRRPTHFARHGRRRTAFGRRRSGLPLCDACARPGWMSLRNQRRRLALGA
jgi:hypothetical protein